MLYPDVTMYITTYKRPNKQRTLLSLPDEFAAETYLVVRESELDAHRQWEKRSLGLLALPAEVDTFAKTRQWCFDECKTRYIIFMDDDLSFSVRKEPGMLNMRKMESLEDFKGMFDALHERAEDGAAHIAVSAIEFNRRYPDEWYNGTRYMRFYMYDTEIIKQEKIQISRMTMMLDFDTSLQLIRKGYPSHVSYKYSQGHETSNAPGGCSDERNSTDPDGLIESTLLKSYHPDFVDIVKKKPKTSWGGKERFDVKIKWSKALESSRKKEPTLFA